LNLERAVRADGRLGGHWVTGHVDGVGRVLGWTAAGRDRVLEVGADECLMAAIAPKGSIACAGVSLTVVAVRGTSFTVHLIPHTLEQTTLGELQPGDPVNLETDLIAKYVGRYLERARAARGLTVDALRRAGFGVGEGEGS
jgi:riboflavin synthase